MKRTLVRVGAVVVVIAVGLGIGGGLITANSGTSAPEQGTPPSQITDSRSVAQSTPATVTASAVTTAPTVAPVNAPAPVAAPALPRAKAPRPTIDRGRTDFEGDIYAVLRGGVITVHFDTDMLRTRRSDKFETVVRETLPAVYGAFADSVLATIPDGALTRDGNLLTDLPTRGVQLPARDGWAITIWPETRSGQDGPLVVSYRASVAQAN